MRVICVDDEKGNLENFRVKTREISQIEDLQLFQNADDAIEWTKEHHVDTAFLDIEMSGCNGIELARILQSIDEDIRIIFVTAYSQYALDAFGVHALGYLLKPYLRSEVEELVERASRMKPRPKKLVKIQTIPDLVIRVDGTVIHMRRKKTEELFALLVDHMEAGLTTGEAIASLWPDKPDDVRTQNLYRVTYHRLMEELKEAGIDSIVDNSGRKKCLKTDLVECDIYQILDGNNEILKKYAGEYLRDYSWAEARNAQLCRMSELI